MTFIEAHQNMEASPQILNGSSPSLLIANESTAARIGPLEIYYSVSYPPWTGPGQCMPPNDCSPPPPGTKQIFIAIQIQNLDVDNVLNVTFPDNFLLCYNGTSGFCSSAPNDWMRYDAASGNIIMQPGWSEIHVGQTFVINATWFLTSVIYEG
jgi:hypothetical protein